jgi:hypothetical protein
VGLHPSVPYQPVPGLVPLFTRTAGSSIQNLRAPHTRPCSVTGFSYATVVSSLMDSDRFNGGNRGTAQRFGGSMSGQANGQGSTFNHGSFNLVNQGFHPRYAGHGPYMGFGGGRYGGCGRPASRPQVHHPGFASQRSRGSEGQEAHGFAGTGKQEIDQ